MSTPTPSHPDADHNLLFGVLALQVDLIDSAQFAEVCTAWTTRKQTALGDLLVERGWITTNDRADVERLLARKLRKHGDARASLAAVADMFVRDSLAGIADADVRHSLGGAIVDSDATPTVEHHPAAPERYGRTRLHAKGGIGQVWVARDRHLGRDVAIKEPRPERASSPAILRRFLKEARITGQLEHPGIVPVYELSWSAGSEQPFYTMRFVKGRTLSDAARDFHRKRVEGREDTLELPALLDAFVMVCNTVAYAHSRGVLHRDLKDQNVVLGDFGEVVVLDWGLAKVLDGADGLGEALVVEDSEGSGPDHTVQGHALGTPAYMAPEQAAGRLDLIDRRSDVYGLGAILYEILTGCAPFPGRDTGEVLRQVREVEPQAPREVWSQVPPGLEAICLQALAKKRDERWESATELGQKVQGWQEAERRQAEEALRASERRYRALAEAIPHIVWTSTPDGANDFWNQRGYEYTGLSREQAAGAGWHDFLHPDDLPRLIAHFTNCLESGTPQEIEYRLRRASDDTYRWHLGRAVPIRDADGRIVQWVGTCTDIDDQKRIEEELRRSRDALRASEHRYRALAEAIPHIVFAATPDGANDFWNRRGYEYTGLSRDQAAGAGWQAYIHPDDLPRLVDHVQNCLRAGSPQDTECRIRRALDGTYRWHLGRGFAIRDTDGTIVEWVGTWTDIEDQKRIEDELRRSREALRASEAFYHAVIDAIQHSVWTANPDGQLDYINRWGLDYYRKSPKEGLGDAWQEVIHPDHLLLTLERWSRALQTGEGYEVEFRVRRHDGVYRWHLSRAIPVRDPEGRICKWIGTSTDVEDQKCAEEELRRSREELKASEAFYHSVIDAIQHSVWTAGPDAQLDYINQWGLAYSGKNPEERLGGGWQRVVHPDDVPLTVDRWTRAMQTGEGYEVEVRVRRYDGVYRWFLCRVVPVRDAEGHIIKWVGTNTDIDDQKRDVQRA